MGQTALSDSVRAIEAEIAAGRPEQALAICQDAQARHPRALAVQRVMGEVYLAMRKTREAVAALDRALAGNPDDARACCARAIVQQMQGDSMGALAWYRRACDTRPDDNVLRAAYRELAASLNQPPYAPTRMGLARLYLRGDLYPHAIREFETLIAEQPDSLEAQVGLAETFWRAQRTQAAAERCQRILVNTPSCVKALLILAAAELAASNGEEARRLVKRVAELDPEQRIGQELFADQLAAGDHALRVLLLGDEPAAAPPSVPLPQPQPRPQTATQSQPLRPAVASQPHPPTQSQPLYQPPAPRPAAPSQPVAPATSTQPRPMNLPPDFHTIFAETEYMLWGHDEETVGRVPAISSNGQPRPDAFGGSSVFVPPALQQQGGPLDDTEARAAINWVSWLQAQGARPHGGMSQGIRGATGPLPPPPPGTGPLVPPPTGPLPWELSASYAPPQNGMAGYAQPRRDTGQLPPPTPEALRQMFAELEPEPSNSRIVDSDLVVESAPVAEVNYGRDSSDVAADRPWAAETDGAVVESEPVEPVASPAAASAFAAFAAQPEPAQNGDAPSYEPSWADSQAADMGWTPSGNLPESFAHLDGADADGVEHTEHTEHTERPEDVETGALAASSADVSWSAPVLETLETPESGDEHENEPAAPLTLEALEHGFTSSGFQSFELRPGGLAAMVGTTDEDAPREHGAFAVPEPAAEFQSEPHNAAQTEHPASHVWSGAEGADDPSTAANAPEEPWAVGEQATGSLGPLDAEAQDTGPLTFGASQPPAMEAFPHAPLAQPEPTDDGAAFSGRPSFPPAHAPVHAPEASAPAQPASEPALAADDYAGRLALARQRRGDGRMDDALAEYRIVLKNSPDLLTDVMNDLRASLAEQPDHPEVHRLLGDAHIRQGDYLSALESYNRAVALTQALGN